MSGERPAFLRQAVLAVAVSLALHLALAAGAGSILFPGALGHLLEDESPLLVAVLTAGAPERAQARPRAVVRAARAQAARMPPAPVVPPEELAPPGSVTAVAAAPPAAADPPPAGASRADASPIPPDAALFSGGLSSFPVPPADEATTETVRSRAEAAGAGVVPPAGSTAEAAARADASAPSAAPPAELAAAPGAPTPAALPAAEAGLAHVDGAQQAGPEAVHDPAGPAPAATSRADAASSPSASSLARLDEVTRSPSLSAGVALEPLVSRREVFEFLLDHPDFATHITRALRLARYRIWRTEAGMFIDDGWGATGQITVVHASSGTRVLYARGVFERRFLPTIPGEAVVTISYDAEPTEDGREILHARISGQLKIDSALASLVLTIARPVAMEKAEKESRRLARTFATVLRAIDQSPAAVYASLRGRPDVPAAELEQFRTLLGLP